MEQTDEIQLLRELIDREAWSELPEQFDLLHVQDIAEAIESLDPAEMALAFVQLPRERWVDVFAYIEPVNQYPLLMELDEEDGRFVLRQLLPDDLTALLESLPEGKLEDLFKLLTPAAVKQALKLLGYPEYSAGRLMNTQFVTVRPDWTLARALDHVRAVGDRGETVNTLYVTDRRGLLLGTVSLKRLVLESPDTLVETLISGPLVSIEAADDQAEAARLIQHYDITTLPVVDRTGLMLGIVTVDDVIDVLEEEVTEDFHKIGAVAALETSLRDASPADLYRKRAGWLVMLVFMNLLGGAAIAYFEATIEAVIALVFFLPLLIGSGGNAGSQAATLMVRALATGDVGPKDWLRLWGKELSVSGALGITMGIAVFGLGLWRGGMEVGMVVALAMICVVVFGSMVGMLLPFLLTRFGFDPAAASAPLITSIADICGILIYFSIATAILTLPVTG
jgi:magnesium transporter